ncbi:MAG: hypothetical protein O7G85_12575 [Planctomycetota bacterium]|nr:hypothetical protein [Planctomycetota bacterium]
MQPNQHVEAANALTRALDQEDYTLAETLLAPDCRYEINDTVMNGRETIIESYRLIGDWVKATFDSYQYSSEVVPRGDDQAIISYRDQIQHGEHELDHRCQQIIKAAPDGLIIEIRHVNLPGEPEKVKAFNKACGVSKPKKQ